MSVIRLSLPPDICERFNQSLNFHIMQSHDISSLVEGVPPPKMLEYIRHSMESLSHDLYELHNPLADTIYSPLIAELFSVIKTLISLPTKDLVDKTMQKGVEGSHKTASLTTASSSSKGLHQPVTKKQQVKVTPLQKPKDSELRQIYQHLNTLSFSERLYKSCESKPSCASCTSLWKGINLTMCSTMKCKDATHKFGWFPHCGKPLLGRFRSFHNNGKVLSVKDTHVPKDGELPSILMQPRLVPEVSSTGNSAKRRRESSASSQSEATSYVMSYADVVSPSSSLCPRLAAMSTTVRGGDPTTWSTQTEFEEES